MRALVAILSLAVALAGGAPAFAQKNDPRGGAVNGAGGNSSRSNTGDNNTGGASTTGGNNTGGNNTGGTNRGGDRNGGGAGDGVVYFSNDDAQMNAAMAEAKRTLPQFWLLYGNDEVVADTGAVKIGFPYGRGGGFEYMWVSNLRRDKGVLKGTLDNAPNHDVGYSEGDTVVVKTEDIVDWTYIRNGRMWGGYTLRVMVREMAPDEARELIDYLSDRPLEGDQI